MPRPKKYREVIQRLRDHDSRFVVYVRRGKGSHRMVWHPDIGGRAESFPLKHHGDNTEIRKGALAAIIRRFNLPHDFFD